MEKIKYGFTENYLTKSGVPWFPVMGEIHYSRCPEKQWKESLYKMKSGGVEVISTYVLWIHHEEVYREYDFEGNRNLRKFVETVKECGLKLFLRIGPWCHAECRNGGFPDWLLKQDYDVRTNDVAYLEEVTIFYHKIFEQVEGLLYSQDGPIIGVQIENEYGHCGGLNGAEGEKHMRLLTQIAKKVGFDVPYYTATGWGGAVTGGLLPVMGGYCEAPWDPRITEIEPSGNYIFTYERNDHNIGSDYSLGTGITYDITKFPYLTAELGGGLQVTKHRRPIAHSRDIGAMSLVKLGSGVNLLGYYMYHGGTNPKGKKTTLQESKESGYPNDLPILNYDFNAPIRQYGQLSETYKEIKLFAMFLQEFGEELCTMPAIIPKDNPLFQNDTKHVRYSYRNNGKKGYLFINNYQRRGNLQEHRNVTIQIPLKEEQVIFEHLEIHDKEYYFYPYNFELPGAIIKTAKATPLCVLHNEKKSYIFYSDKEPEYKIEGTLEHCELITITREEAKNAYKIQREKEYLIISDSPVVMEEEAVIYARKQTPLKIYPALEEVPKGMEQIGEENGFTLYYWKEAWSGHTSGIGIRQMADQKDGSIVYELNMNYEEEMLQEEIFLKIEYLGADASLFIGEELVADHFYTGQQWEIALSQLKYPQHLKMVITPISKETPVYLENWRGITERPQGKIKKIMMELERKITIF